MIVVEEIDVLRRVADDARRGDATVGLLPTMGCFHARHEALMPAPRREPDLVTTTTSANPCRFGAD